jgi:large subunit ribosomal protein L19
MNQLVREIQDEHLRDDIPEFEPGDTIRVHVRLVDEVKQAKATRGEKGPRETRVQAFEGDCIARKGAGLEETFTVRRAGQVGVERTFMVHSPHIQRIEVLARRGGVGRAKLYYLRGRIGKGARVRRAVRQPRR